MTPEQALNTLYKVTRQVNNPAEFHEECRAAAEVLKSALASRAEAEAPDPAHEKPPAPK